ncbi:hypothetical protein [Bradyrhizobium erythrophlei]|uniref:Uncharacterized protein n=1 Tax=Bradyrhizobium erythrophlei TaxID=1437360 RepID=A0A1M7U5W8_9BRAD|nr:hypothetical protein [Bradyrhizobium erythrophlei]SHN78286.1 hypothetical protein SAMN05444170_3630 [Bradyrhizobium erythrophlei]
MLPGFLAEQTRVSVDLMLVDPPVRLAEEGIYVALRIGPLEDKKFQTMWVGAKYAVTRKSGCDRRLYSEFFLRHPRGGLAPCVGTEHPQCAGTFDAISAAVDWRFAPKWDVYSGIMFTQVNGGLPYGFLQRNNVAPTVGLRFRF